MSTSDTNSASEPFPLQLMGYVNEEDIKKCREPDKNIGLAMAGSAKAVCDAAKRKTSANDNSNVSSTSAAESITGPRNYRNQRPDSR